MRCSLNALLIGTAAATLARAAWADPARTPSGAPTVSQLIVTGRAGDLERVATSANQGQVSAADLALRPLLRPGEVVEEIPGVIITQHSGSGKANQYFLRGFNLDHGTDLAISLDGMPVNLPSHAHGQGYADLNFLIPEIVSHVNYEKGPYYADVGDFGSAGAFAVHYADRTPGLLRVEAGQSGFARGLVADTFDLRRTSLLVAAEIEHNDGPWSRGDDERKLNGVARLSGGDDRNGWSLTAMAYHNIWNSTDQIPDRAIAGATDPVGAPAPPAADLISRWGEVDPSDGGNSGRYSLSGDWRRTTDRTRQRLSVYGFCYDLDLFSNFTYFLEDPVHGDQIEQQDERWVVGGAASQTWSGLFGGGTDATVGLQARADLVRNGLYHTEARMRLGATTVNDIDETMLSPYAELETHWTPWLRTTLGLRADALWVDVRNLAGGDSGRVAAHIVSPKVSVVLGPWARTELYFDYGQGFHSNDARGIVSVADPATPLVRSEGEELGVRTSIVPHLRSEVSLWRLDFRSELVWDGDEGTNEPSGPTRRYGVELDNWWTPTPWLTLDADYAWSHARFTDDEPEGSYVPEALVATFDGGIAVHDLPGALGRWSGGLRLRYFGPRPLTQDDSVRSKATALVYAEIGYRLTPRISLGLSIFNLLNSKTSDIDYDYVSRLLGEPLAGVSDIHTHPSEPREARVSLSAAL